MGNDLTKVINGYKRFGFPKKNCGGKIEGRHIPIIALSEYHVDYMNRKGWYSVIMQGEPFHRCDVYIGKPGLVHGARILANSDFYC